MRASDSCGRQTAKAKEEIAPETALLRVFLRCLGEHRNAFARMARSYRWVLLAWSPLAGCSCDV